jgi:cytochrome c oxidase subunit 2
MLRHDEIADWNQVVTRERLVMLGRIPSVLCIAALCLRVGTAHAEFNLNLQSPATPIAQQIYDLHTLILLVCLFIFVVVFGFMFYAIFRYRKSVGHKAALFHENLKLEIFWTVIPFLILIGMAFPASKTVLAMKNTGQPDMSIKITGRQWLWEYEYMGEGVKYFSKLATPQEQIDNHSAKTANYLLEVDHPLVVPTGKKVRVLVTSADVIHSWWVPQFGVKQDGIPGFIRESWFQVDKPGTYRGQCAELCGVHHAFMPIVVEAMLPAQYAEWLAKQKTSMVATVAASGKTYSLDELKTHGAEVYAARCAMCHQANGQGMPGMFPPLVDAMPFTAGNEVTAPLAERGFWKADKIVLGPKERHLDIVMNGIPGTAMQAFGEQLPDFDLAAVVSFERNNWGNHTGDAIQPSEVAALRKGKTS